MFFRAVDVAAAELRRRPRSTLVVLLALILALLVCFIKGPKNWYEIELRPNKFNVSLLGNVEVDGAEPADFMDPTELPVLRPSGAKPPCKTKRSTDTQAVPEEEEAEYSRCFLPGSDARLLLTSCSGSSYELQHGKQCTVSCRTPYVLSDARYKYLSCQNGLLIPKSAGGKQLQPVPLSSICTLPQLAFVTLPDQETKARRVLPRLENVAGSLQLHHPEAKLYVFSNNEDVVQRVNGWHNAVFGGPFPTDLPQGAAVPWAIEATFKLASDTAPVDADGQKRLPFAVLYLHVSVELRREIYSDKQFLDNLISIDEEPLLVQNIVDQSKNSFFVFVVNLSWHTSFLIEC